MRYFIDTEFIQDGPYRPIELISIGAVNQDGETFYAQNLDTHFDGADEWFHANVYAHLDNIEYWHHREGDPGPWRTYSEIGQMFRAFIGHEVEPEFWGWCCDYDYVIVSQLIGFKEWPDGWPYYFRDIQQEADRMQKYLQTSQAVGRHHALEDAREVHRLWKCLQYAPVDRWTS